MRKILVYLGAAACLYGFVYGVFLRDSAQALSTGILSKRMTNAYGGTALVHTGRCMLWGYVAQGDGTNATGLTLIHDGLTNAGTVVGSAMTEIADSSIAVMLLKPIECATGIYATMTESNVQVFYEPLM